MWDVFYAEYKRDNFQWDNLQKDNVIEIFDEEKEIFIRDGKKIAKTIKTCLFPNKKNFFNKIPKFNLDSDSDRNSSSNSNSNSKNQTKNQISNNAWNNNLDNVKFWSLFGKLTSEDPISDENFVLYKKLLKKSFNTFNTDINFKKINRIELEEGFKYFLTNKLNQNVTILKTKKNLNEYEDKVEEDDDDDENVLDENWKDLSIDDSNNEQCKNEIAKFFTNQVKIAPGWDGYPIFF